MPGPLTITGAPSSAGAYAPEQEKALDAVTSGIVNKLLHSPTVELKRMASNRHHTEHVGLIRKLFGL